MEEADDGAPAPAPRRRRRKMSPPRRPTRAACSRRQSKPAPPYYLQPVPIADARADRPTGTGLSLALAGDQSEPPSTAKEFDAWVNVDTLTACFRAVVAHDQFGVPLGRFSGAGHRPAPVVALYALGEGEATTSPLPSAATPLRDLSRPQASEPLFGWNDGTDASTRALPFEGRHRSERRRPLRKVEDSIRETRAADLSKARAEVRVRLKLVTYSAMRSQSPTRWRPS